MTRSVQMNAFKLSLFKKHAGLLFTALFLAFFASTTHALRCGTHLISEGDLALEVQQYCGKPDWIDRWYDRIIIGKDTTFEHILDNINERWVYNFGPQQFMRFLTIRNSRVVNIETGPYGFTMSDTSFTCDTSDFSLGISALEVRSRCGEPDAKSRRYETVTQPIVPGANAQATVPVDEWIYNLGPQYFVRILTFFNGELIDITTGSRGF